MIKRALYFWLERLKINPAERKAVLLLLVLLVILSVVNAVLKQSSPYDEAYYAELERMFKQRSSLLRKKEAGVLARYQPGEPEVILPESDTLPAERLKIDTAPDSGLVQEPERININVADAGLLESLPGIGPVYARRIIDYRSKNGPYTTLEELLKIKGIGKKRLEKLKPFIKLKGSTGNQ